MKTQLFRFFLASGLFWGACAVVSAQDAVPVPPPCSSILKDSKAAMQKEADAGCKSVTRCVSCMDEKLKQVVFVTLVVDPGSETCNPDAKPKMVKAKQGNTAPVTGTPASAGDGKADFAPDPVVNFAVLQDRCASGTGTNLSVYIPSDATQCSTDRYKFEWEVDGAKSSTTPRLDCACGKQAKVKVTDTRTGLGQTKVFKLRACKQ